MAWKDLGFDILSDFSESQYLTEWRLADIKENLIVKVKVELTPEQKKAAAKRKKKWDSQNREYYRHYMKEWTKRNPDYRKEYMKEYRAKKRAERPAVARKTPLSHKERCARYRQRRREEIQASKRTRSHETSLGQ